MLSSQSQRSIFDNHQCNIILKSNRISQKQLYGWNCFSFCSFDKREWATSFSLAYDYDDERWRWWWWKKNNEDGDDDDDIGIEGLRSLTLWCRRAVRQVIHFLGIQVTIFPRWDIAISIWTFLSLLLLFLSNLVLVFLGLFICRRKQRQLLNIQPTRKMMLIVFPIFV